VQVGAGVPGVGVRRNRQAGVEADDGDLEVGVEVGVEVAGGSLAWVVVGHED
jgi:hypothetical protein